MNKNKKGFTLEEVLITMAIVGIVMAIAVQSIKIVKASYTSLAFFAERNVRQLAGEMINVPDVTKRDTSNGMSRIIISDEETVTITAADGTTSTKSTDSVFCEQMANFSNTSGIIKCTDDDLFEVEKNEGDIYPQIVFDATNTTEEPNYYVTNGTRYYISKHVNKNDPDGRSVSSKYGYRLVAVDLNGKSIPNIANPTGNRIPDIVTFMIMDNGEMYPLGVVADNIVSADGRIVIYLNSRVNGYYFGSNVNGNPVARECDVTGRCDFRVVETPNSHHPLGQENATFHSYRQAYCHSLGQNPNPTYEDYCDGALYNGNDNNCPISSSSTVFDECRVKIVKPMFRYNF